MKVINEGFPEKEKCISEEKLLHYMQGDLDVKQQHEIEMHLLHCDLCSDAFDGLRLIQNKDKTTEIVAALKHKVNEYLIKDKVTRPVYIQWWQVAAIFVILLLGAGSYFVIRFYTVNPSENSVAIKTQDEITEQSPPAAMEQKKINVPKSAEVTTDHPVEKTTEEAVKEEFVTRESTDLLSPVSATAVSDEELSKAKKDIEYAPAAKAEQQLEATDNSRLKNKNNEKLSISAKEPINELQFNEGLQLYNQNNYSMALNSFERAGSDPKVSFYAGKCQYNLNNYHEAINEIDKAIEDSSSQFYEEALWLKANSLLGLKKKEKAKPILKKVIQLNGNFKNEANNLLKTL